MKLHIPRRSIAILILKKPKQSVYFLKKNEICWFDIDMVNCFGSWQLEKKWLWIRIQIWMGYLQFGRHGVRQIIRFRDASYDNVVVNPLLYASQGLRYKRKLQVILTTVIIYIELWCLFSWISFNSIFWFVKY